MKKIILVVLLLGLMPGIGYLGYKNYKTSKTIEYQQQVLIKCVYYLKTCMYQLESK